MAAKKAPKKLNKSEFIRSQPESLTAAEIVAKAKEAGIKLSGNLVYMVRGANGSAKKTVAKKSAPAKKTTAKTSAKKTAPKSEAPKKAGESKADFVRATPSLSANEVAAKAKAEGITLDANYVYSVRGQDKAAAKKKRAAKKLAASTPMVTKTSATSKPTAPKPPTSNGTRPSGSSVEDLLKAAAAELGLGRALEILQGERARVRAVIGG